MSYREAKELAQLRQVLRDGLSAADVRGVWPALERLRQFAASDADLRAEYDRWAFRFELISVAA
jgi:hypothetical protein